MLLDKRSIGLVEDDAAMGEPLIQRLELEGARVRWWQTGNQALLDLPHTDTDAIICDLRLPGLDGEALFRAVTNRRRMPPFLFMTAYADLDQAVRLLRDGAGDYVTKPFDMPVLLQRLLRLLPDATPDDATELGRSTAMRQIARLLRRLAPLRTSVLLTGETGVGKEVVARHLHALSGDAAGPFMAVNCAAIPAELMEAELFGHERGAFTGAAQRHIGYSERAGKGVLFLDEIGDLALPLQAKLLRLLEERRFYRVGGEAPVAFDARVIAATHADLATRVQAGRFREDLYYRINVVPIEIPPLRERPEDIVWLLDRFVEEFILLCRSPLAGLSAQTEEAVMAYAWPGNVRELRNRVERAVALSLGPWLMPGDLFPEQAYAAVNTASTALTSLKAARDAAERRHIHRALLATSGEISAAARAIGISRTTLWEKMRRFGLDDTAG